MSTKPEFAELIERHGREIFVFLYRLLQDSPEAEDCLQEAYLRAYQAYDRLDGAANLRAWLYRIANNLAMTRLKQRERGPSSLNSELAGTGPSVESQVEKQELLEQVRAAVWALPHKQRAALVMRKYQDLSYDEIALALEINPEAARANVYQGLKKLRRQFAAEPRASVGVSDPAGAGEPARR